MKMSNLTIYSFYIKKSFLPEWEQFSKIAEFIEKDNYLEKKKVVAKNRKTSKNYGYKKKDFRVIALEKLIRGYNKKHQEEILNKIKLSEKPTAESKEDFADVFNKK